jgi:cytochrome c oxidase cbb3-type subunit III
MRAAASLHLILDACALALLASGCEREERRFRETPPSAAATAVALTDLQPGPGLVLSRTQGPYDGNAYGISEGQRLFSWYNCSGCHSHGGGGMGPPLMDDEWIYGSDPSQIFSSIVEGRPNGMPTFRGKIPNYQVWQIVAYVRSLSGLTPKAARPGRGDDMQFKTAEQQLTPAKPKNSATPE